MSDTKKFFLTISQRQTLTSLLYDHLRKLADDLKEKPQSKAVLDSIEPKIQEEEMLCELLKVKEHEL